MPLDTSLRISLSCALHCRAVSFLDNSITRWLLIRFISVLQNSYIKLWTVSFHRLTQTAIGRSMKIANQSTSFRVFIRWLQFSCGFGIPRSYAFLNCITTRFSVSCSHLITIDQSESHDCQLLVCTVEGTTDNGIICLLQIDAHFTTWPKISTSSSASYSSRLILCSSSDPASHWFCFGFHSTFVLDSGSSLLSYYQSGEQIR